MRVILKAEVFVSQHIHQVDLISLIKLGFDGRHLIQVEPPDANELSNWLGKQSDDIRDECELVFKSGYSLDRDEYGQFSPLTIQIAHVDKPQWLQTIPVLPLEIALKFLSQDFIIFVENRRNDSAFLRATATGWRKEKLEELLKNGGIKFEGGGGIGEILKWIEEIANIPENPKVLPYNYQSVLLAEAMRANPLPNDAVSQELKNWLWRSAYTEAFIGINETNMANAVKEILSFAKGNVYKIGIIEKIAPLPKRFHFSSSRAKLLALRLAELTPQAVDGKALKVGELLGLHGSYAIIRLFSTSSAPENCFIVEPQASSQFRSYLLNSQTNWKKDFLRSHAISEKAAQALKLSDYKSFMSERRKTLIELEKEFIQPLGLDYDSE